MTLLLGVLYFGCRWIRIGVIANDVVQLARNDELPWFSAWSRMPDDPPLARPCGEVFPDPARSQSGLAVVFLAESFAVRIGCRMPALNTPAIAMRSATAIFPEPEQVIHNFASLLSTSGGSPLTLPNLDSEARVLALLTVAAAMVHVHDARSRGGEAESGSNAMISRPVKVPWSRADLEACTADLRTYATFLRHALDNPSVESRMSDTCSVLRTWAEEQIDDGEGAQLSDRATARPLPLIRQTRRCLCGS